MIWRLQVKVLHDTPLILSGKMYAGRVDGCNEHMLRPDCPLASPKNRSIPTCVDDGPGILRLIKDHHAAWLQR